MSAITKAAAKLFGRVLIGGAKKKATDKKKKKQKSGKNKKGSLAEKINFGGKNQ